MSYRIAALFLAAGAVYAQNDTEALRRIADLELRLAKAEALIEKLLAPPVAASPEVLRSEAAVQNIQPQRTMPQELLPKLGIIGATASFTAGVHSGPYSSGMGSFLSGAVELPLLKAPGGLLLYEFSAGLSRSDSQFKVTSNVAQVANLAVLGPSQAADALNGTGAAPFPVTVDAKSHISLLQVVPFALKYRPAGLERWRLRPYAVLGFGTYVTISNQTTATGVRNVSPDLQALFGNGAPFGGALIGGQIAAAKELTQRGIPSGQGGIELGFQTGGGLEYRWRDRFSWGFDVRYNRMANGIQYFTVAPRGALHF